MKSKIKISAVSYLNTLPFIYGIEHKIKEKIDLQLDMPSICAKKFIEGLVDIALVPVAALIELKDCNVITDYCIGATGKVRSVLLVSDVPLTEIKTIYLDYQSRTSVNLVRILANEFWNINPQWIQASEGYENYIGYDKAGVIIGDRTFNLIKNYKYQYDLAYEWIRFTGLPFVFAAWIARKHVEPEFINELNQAFTYGINNIDEVVKQFEAENKKNNINLQQYYSQNISYKFDEEKQKGMKLFLKYLTTF